jgi:hypothetical protein
MLQLLAICLIRLDARPIALAADATNARVEFGTLAVLCLFAALTANFRVKL